MKLNKYININKLLIKVDICYIWCIMYIIIKEILVINLGVRKWLVYDEWKEEKIDNGVVIF